MNISKEDVLVMLEKIVKDYYLIKEYEENGLLVNHHGWYEAKSKEAAEPLSSFLVSTRKGNYKGNFKINLPSQKEIGKNEKIIREKKDF